MTQAVIGDERPSLPRIDVGDAVAAHTLVLVGNPNVGKTTLFNALTGDTARVGNYPGVTVERRTGRLRLEGGDVDLVDVPGTYSLSARSGEEQVALEAVLGLGSNPRPSLAIVLLDAGQLTRNLYLALQLVEFQIPTLFVLTMMDETTERPPIPDSVGRIFGVPCVAVNPKTRKGVSELRAALSEYVGSVRVGDVRVDYPAPLLADIDRAAEALPTEWRRNVEHDRAFGLWALLSLDSQDELNAPVALRERCIQLREEAQAQQRDLDLEIVGARYAFLDAQIDSAYDLPAQAAPNVPWTERIDKVLLHPLLGFVFFLGVMLGIFQSLFSWADPAITLIEDGVALAQDFLSANLPPGLVTDLLVQGVFGGVGNVIVFLPQILLLFFLVGLLEDSGYMARIAYLMDRVLRSVGLHGKAFVPMLGGLACAVPAIMATRTMERRRDRLLTMLVIPLMSCSARLPVYALLIAALIPPSQLFGWVPVQGLLMVGMYVFSTLTTLMAAWVLGRTVVKGRHVPLLLELPRYRWPSLGNTLRMMWERAKQFLTEAGTVILAFTVIMWMLLSFPKPPEVEAPLQPTATQVELDSNPTQATSGAAATASSNAEAAVQYSYAGRLGKTLEPVMRPLGFDWRITVGIIGAFSAREVFVSTLGLVFGLEDAEADDAKPLRDRLQAETRADGTPAYTPLVALSLMIFFALACQCMSTIAVVYRETQSWRWPVLLFTYMTTLAYVASLSVYQLGRLFGFGG